MPPSPIQLTPDAVIRRNPSILTADVPPDLVLMRVDAGAYYGLNASGGEIWRRLESPQRMVDLCRALEAAHTAEPGVIAQDVQEMVLSLAERGLLEVDA